MSTIQLLHCLDAGDCVGGWAPGSCGFHLCRASDRPRGNPGLGAPSHRWHSHLTMGLNTRSHLVAGRPHFFSFTSALAISCSRLGRLGVRWASTTVLPSRVGLKAHTASSPKAALIFCMLA